MCIVIFCKQLLSASPFCTGSRSRPSRFRFLGHMPFLTPPSPFIWALNQHHERMEELAPSTLLQSIQQENYFGFFLPRGACRMIWAGFLGCMVLLLRISTTSSKLWHLVGFEWILILRASDSFLSASLPLH